MKCIIIGKSINKIDLTAHDDLPNHKYMYAGGTVRVVLINNACSAVIEMEMPTLTPNTRKDEIVDIVIATLRKIIN